MKNICECKEFIIDDNGDYIIGYLQDDEQYGLSALSERVDFPIYIQFYRVAFNDSINNTKKGVFVDGTKIHNKKQLQELFYNNRNLHRGDDWKFEGILKITEINES